MRLRTLIHDDNAVSPVIGVILMVAITVILAAVIGTFVLGLGDTAQTKSPAASFDTDYSSADSELTLTHESGDAIDAERLKLTGGDVAAGSNVDHFGDADDMNADEMSSGDSITIKGASDWSNRDNHYWWDGGSRNSDGATVRIVWTSQDGETSATLKEWTGPDG